MDQPAEEFRQALLAMDRVAALAVLGGALRPDDPFTSLEEVVVPALESIGDAWENGPVSLAQLYMAGRIAEEAVRQVAPETGPYTGSRIGIAVLEDHHALGKRLVLSALRAAGYGVQDYGHGLSVSRLAQRVHEDRPDVLLVSTLMLPSALSVRRLVAELELPGSRPTVIVGGAPFRMDPGLWHEVGADATGRNSAEAVALVQQFTGGAS